MKIRISKKRKYFIYSVVISLLLLQFPYLRGNIRIFGVAVVVLIGVAGSLLIQLPSITRSTFLTVILLPAHLVAGSILSLIYFPNLGIVIKLGAIISFGMVLYAVSLVNNVFLVIEEKEKVIPLYRAAVTWAYVLLVITAIPYFAGIYKIPVNSLVQNLIAGASSFLFTYYLLWVQEFDVDVKKIRVGEKVINSLFVGFLVVCLGLGVSFLPTESFLRALYVSSVLMVGLGYMQAHYKNIITRKLISEYLLISLVFLIIVLVFRP